MFFNNLRKTKRVATYLLTRENKIRARNHTLRVRRYDLTIHFVSNERAYSSAELEDLMDAGIANGYFLTHANSAPANSGPEQWILRPTKKAKALISGYHIFMGYVTWQTVKPFIPETIKQIIIPIVVGVVIGIVPGIVLARIFGINC